LPPALVSHLKQIPLIINPGARGMIANARLVDLIRMFGLIKETTKAWPLAYDAVSHVVADMPLHVVSGPLSVVRNEEPPTSDDGPRTTDDGQNTTDDVAVDSARLLALLVDRSVSDPYSGDTKNAFARIQERANELLTRISLKPDENLHVALTIYGLDSLGLPEIRTGFDGALAGRLTVPAAELAASALRRESTVEEIPNGVGGLIEVPREKLTFLELEPTRGCSPLPAFESVKQALDSWTAEHSKAGNPPIVLHLTRGGQSEGDLREAVGLINGAAVYHLVVTEEPHASLAYPSSDDEIQDSNIRLLAELSSPLGDEFADHPAVKNGSRGIVVNGKFECLP
jgi:hypothetical protein